MSNEADLPIDVVVERRFELVEAIALIQGRHKAELEPLQEELAMCEKVVQMEMTEKNQDSQKINGHNMFFQGGSRASLEDMDAFVDFLVAAPAPDGWTEDEWQRVRAHVKAHGNWHFLNKVVRKESVEEYVEQHKVAPPGVKRETFRTLQWRKGKPSKTV